MKNENDVFIETEEDGMNFEGTAVEATDGDAQQQQPHAKRKKRKGPYATHGIFSRSPWKALAKAGEDMKKLGQTEHMLFEHFQPRNPFEAFLFDRAWCCVLRCVLIGRMEERIFSAGDKLEEDKAKDIADIFGHSGARAHAEGLLIELSSVLRYDAFYAKGFLHWIGILVALQNGEHEHSVFQLSKKLGNTKAEES